MKGVYSLKDKFETFRASEKERQQLKSIAKKANMSKSDFIRHAVFNKEIVVIDGFDDFTKQLKAIGNNLNQLTTRANMGHFQTVNLTETKEQLGKIYDLLTALCRQESFDSRQEEPVKVEIPPQRSHNLFSNSNQTSDEVDRMLDILGGRNYGNG